MIMNYCGKQNRRAFEKENSVCGSEKIHTGKEAFRGHGSYLYCSQGCRHLYGLCLYCIRPSQVPL